jgi:L-ascorbate metabolism protein UlaG (beta-lactamase superfamily)
MGVEDAVAAVEFVRPGMAIPMHYNTFPVIEADPEAFRSAVFATGLNARVMQYAETIEL